MGRSVICVEGRAAAGALLAVLSLVPTVARAQTPPPRDARAPVVETSGRIQGRVTATDGQRPLRLAEVVASPAPRAGLSVTRTDTEGRYELELPPGRYTVTARKPGFVTLAYGQRRVDEGGTLVEVTSDHTIEDIDVALPSGAVLAGRVSNAYGEPVPDARVQAFRYRYREGRWQLVRTGRPRTTDDRGAYRLFGLPPGEYYIEAQFAPFGFSGYATDRRYVPTFYPSSAGPDAARRVALAIGQELSGLDIGLTSTLTSNVRGRVLDLAATAGTATTVGLHPRGPTLSAHRVPGASVRGDGSFEISGVPPGEYVAHAATGVGPGRRFAQTPITVSGYDVDGVVLALGPGASARGQILFERGAVPDFQPSSLQPFTMSEGFDPLPFGRGSGHVNDDWTFEIRGMSGPQLVRLLGLPEGWELQRVELAGRDVTDTAIEFRQQMPTTGLYLLVSHRATRLRGAVVERDGSASTDATVVIFSEEPDRWSYPSRFVRATRLDRAGRFAVDGLPAGRYLALAAPAVPDGAWTDPGFLSQVRPMSTPFALGTGEERELLLENRATR